MQNPFQGTQSRPPYPAGQTQPGMTGTGMPPYPPVPQGGVPYRQMPGAQQIPGTQQMPGAQQMPGTQQMPNPGWMPPVQGQQPTGFIPSQPQDMQNGIPPKKRHRLTAFQIGIILAVVLLIGWYVFQNYAPQTQQYATVRAGMLGAYYTGDALIIRNETPYDADGVTSINYIAEEGSLVARSMPICDVYSSGFSTRETNTLQDYRDQIRDYQRELLRQETTYDARMEVVETDVILRAREVRDIIAGMRGNLTNQQTLLDTAIAVRQQYLRQKYSADQRLSRLYDDEQAQLQRIDSWTKQYVSTRESIVSFYCDGYEYGLTAANYDQFTPQEVRRMIQGNLPEQSQSSKSKTTIYRTVNDGQWYVLMLADDKDWNPVKDQTYQLQIERQENTNVQATVVDFSRAGGDLLVKLQVNSSVKPVLYMRTCRATLGDSITTMMVPARAIYRQDDMDGVVVVDGSNQLFVPVQIVYTQGSDVYVSSIHQGLLFDGQTVMLF